MPRYRIMLSISLGLVLLASWSQAVSSSAPSSLRFVHAVWRHGDRAPLWQLANTNDVWPDGEGELTMKGMEQQFRLGKYIKRRYDGYLSVYTPDEIFVRSTDYNRTIMSAMANLAGMYSNLTSDQRFIPNLDWKPVPVHSMPRPYDYLAWTDRECPTADDEYWNDVQTSPKVMKVWNENKELLDFLMRESAITITRIHDVNRIYDPLFAESAHNDTNPQPRWINESVWEKVVYLHDFSKQVMFDRLSIQKFRGGPLLAEILERMEKRANGSLDTKLKYYAYSAVKHDTTLVALLEALGLYERIKRLPPYAAAVFIELHEKQPREFTVEIHYENDLDKPPSLLSMDDCKSPCSLAQFRKRSESRFLAEDWFTACGLNTDRRTIVSLQGTVIGLGIGLGIVLLAFIVLGAFLVFRRR